MPALRGYWCTKNTMKTLPEDEVVRGCAPGVDVATHTFTCPRCRATRGCQALNPRCLACGYQDPRRFELPADFAYVITD